MPTYQYACTECGHDFEQFQSFSDNALTECPQCSGKLRKVYNAVGVVFKGSGFYRNDSRPAEKSGSDSSSGTSDAGSSGGSGSGSGDSGSGDSGSGDSSTPAKKTDTTPSTPKPAATPTSPAKTSTPS